MTSSRSDCSRSELIFPHAIPAFFKARTTVPTVRLRLVKTIPDLTLRSFNRRTKTSSFW